MSLSHMTKDVLYTVFLKPIKYILLGQLCTPLKKRRSPFLQFNFHREYPGSIRMSREGNGLSRQQHSSVNSDRLSAYAARVTDGLDVPQLLIEMTHHFLTRTPSRTCRSFSVPAQTGLRLQVLRNS